ncbi:hypothetical protein MKX01_005227, partial [Papaver californicum]
REIIWSCCEPAFLPIAMTQLVGSFRLTSLTLLCYYEKCRVSRWAKFPQLPPKGPMMLTVSLLFFFKTMGD